MSLVLLSIVCCVFSKSPTHTVALGGGGNILPPLSLIWFNSRSETKATAARNQQKQDSGHENIARELAEISMRSSHGHGRAGVCTHPSQSPGAVRHWLTSLVRYLPLFPAKILQVWFLAICISSIWKLVRMQILDPAADLPKQACGGGAQISVLQQALQVILMHLEFEKQWSKWTEDGCVQALYN